MAETVTFVAPVRPVGKGRPRATRTATGVRMLTPRKTALFEAAIRAAAMRANASPIDGPIKLSVCAQFAPAKSWPKARKQAAAAQPPHCQAPDADNIGKAVADALNGVCYLDDAAIASIRVDKVWALQDSVIVTVESWN